MSAPSADAMPAYTPFDPCDELIALGVDKRISNLPLSARAGCRAEWIVGAVVAVDDRAVHADYWERHPGGDETLYLLEGHLAITLAPDGTAERCANLEAGQACIVPKGVWHRLQVLEPCRLIFISSPKGTEHRPYEPGLTPESSLLATVRRSHPRRRPAADPDRVSDNLKAHRRRQ